MKHHPDFPKDSSTDMVLQSNDDVLFHVTRADLMRSSSIIRNLSKIGLTPEPGERVFKIVAPPYKCSFSRRTCLRHGDLAPARDPVETHDLARRTA